MQSFILLATAMVPLVAAHGYIGTPKARVVGDAMKTACGQQIANNQGADNGGNIQGETQLKGTDFTADCNLWLCKGYQFADNTANVQSYTVGEQVAIHYDIRAPHDGVANVSIVDTASNTVIGSPLIEWSIYASTATGVTAGETDFTVTIPDLGGKCTTAGECVIQHYWDARSVDQTYESCIDFTVGASSGGSPAVSSSAAASTVISTRIATSIVSSSTAFTGVATSSAAAQTTVTPTTSAPAAPIPTDDGGDDEGDDEGDDDSCEPEETGVETTPTATATSSTPAPTDPADEDDGEGDDEDDDACDTTTAVPVTSAQTTAAPTTFVTRTSSAVVSASPTSGVGAVALYGQCGGTGYTGSTTCASGTCKVQNPYYSQCV